MPLFGFFLHRSYSNDQADAILLREDVIGEVVYEPAAQSAQHQRSRGVQTGVHGPEAGIITPIRFMRRLPA